MNIQIPQMIKKKVGAPKKADPCSPRSVSLNNEQTKELTESFGNLTKAIKSLLKEKQ